MNQTGMCVDPHYWCGNTTRALKVPSRLINTVIMRGEKTIMKSHQHRDSPPLAEITVAKISKMSSDVIRSWLHSPEDHGAVLPVKGEVVYRNGTSTTVNGRRQPVNTAVRRHQGIAVQGNLELAVHTIAGKIEMSSTVVKKKKKKKELCCLLLTCSPVWYLAARWSWRGCAEIWWCSRTERTWAAGPTGACSHTIATSRNTSALTQNMFNW